MGMTTKSAVSLNFNNILLFHNSQSPLLIEPVPTHIREDLEVCIFRFKELFSLFLKTVIISKMIEIKTIDILNSLHKIILLKLYSCTPYKNEFVNKAHKTNQNNTRQADHQAYF